MKFLYCSLKSGFVLFVFSVLILGCVEKSVARSAATAESTPPIKTAKPGAAIKLVSDSLLSVVANEVVHTDIVLQTSEPSGELIIDFSATQGLSLENTITSQTIKFHASSPIKIPIVVKALSDGRYYLNLRIKLNNAATASVRNLALIIQAGPLSEKASRVQKIAGENVIVLPAQETISSNKLSR